MKSKQATNWITRVLVTAICLACVYGLWLALPYYLVERHVDLSEDKAKWPTVILKAMGRQALPALVEKQKALIKHASSCGCGNGVAAHFEQINLVSELIVDCGAVALPHLQKLLNHKNKFVRLLTLSTLSKFGPKAQPLVPDIKAWTTDSDATVRATAIGALVEIEGRGDWPEQALEWLKDPSQREFGRQTLSYLEDPKIIPKVLPLLHDPDPKLRAAAIDTLPMKVSASVIEKVIPKLKDSNPRVREQAVWKLSHWRVKQARSQIEAMKVNDPDGDVRWAAEEYVSYNSEDSLVGDD